MPKKWARVEFALFGAERLRHNHREQRMLPMRQRSILTESTLSPGVPRFADSINLRQIVS
ncbi:hypothetical protein [Salipiger mangrovisoli]|uniref:hypothetical protein n=1 Tax=Salipiger mangrovisoli TaxID=2865933 RepID=UPI00187F6F8D|nr:hypothetical protein [Salipiger mangrovisoli]